MADEKRDSNADDTSNPLVVDVTLLNKYPEIQGFGLDISGGIDRPYAPGDNGIFVSALKSNGLAEKSGQINIGDKILEVNGVNVENVIHQDAVNLFLSNKNEVRLKLHKNYALLLRAASATPSSQTSSSTPDVEEVEPLNNEVNIAPVQPLSRFSISGFIFGIALGCASVMIFKRYVFKH